MARYTPSILPCTFLYSGMHSAMMPMTASASSGMTATKTSAAAQSTVNAMIIAPNTMSGERSSRRSVMLTPDCT